jgi:methionyl-tRNA synthetase
MDEIDIKDFLKLDLRVAKIEEAEAVEDADKLVKLILDLGSEGKKQVFAGIKKFYEPKNLVGKLVVCVANLKSREMRFGTSEGMILAASNENSGVYILNPDDGAEPGMKVS